MVIVLTGVTGVGKTTVGQALAAALRWRFADADDYHSGENIAKMRSGIPLDDTDRTPWLKALHDAIASWLAHNENVVLACSALKAAYRAGLAINSDVRLVYLRGNEPLIAARLSGRSEHFMDPALLHSQFETLEEPHDVLTVDADRPVGAIVDQIRTSIGV